MFSFYLKKEKAELQVSNELWDMLDKIQVPSAKKRVAEILGWSQQRISYLLMGKKIDKSDCELFNRACIQASSEQQKQIALMNKIIQSYYE